MTTNKTNGKKKQVDNTKNNDNNNFLEDIKKYNLKYCLTSLHEKIVEKLDSDSDTDDSQKLSSDKLSKFKKKLKKNIKQLEVIKDLPTIVDRGEKLQKFLDDGMKRVYDKNWPKLKYIHKIDKIKEYVNEMDISDIKKNKLIKKYTKLLDNKTLKNNLVTYEDGKITSISDIE